MSDLIHLIDSAADDFGLDLEQSSVLEDDVFCKALWNRMRRSAAPTYLGLADGTSEERVCKKRTFETDSQTRNTIAYPKVLYGASKRCTERFDLIPGRLDTRIQSRREFQPAADHTQIETNGSSVYSWRSPVYSRRNSIEFVPELAEDESGGSVDWSSTCSSACSTPLSPKSKCPQFFVHVLPSEP